MKSAYVFVQVGPGGDWKTVDELHHALHAVAGVKMVHFVAGPTDVVLFVEAADEKGLMETVGGLRSVKGVQSTDTRIVLPI